MDKEYEWFILQNSHTLFYASFIYRNLLKSYLEAEPIYLGALDSTERLSAVLPTFLKINKRYGNVINSLPFYGSNGGIIEHQRDLSLKKNMLSFFEEVAQENECVATTIITSPFEETADFYNENASFDFLEKRIGQITVFPEKSENVAEALMKVFTDPRPRNIKKAIKSGVQVRWSQDSSDLDFLFQVHHDNIIAVGGIPKERRFFEKIAFNIPKSNYKIYVAELEGVRVAALLLFYYNKTVEYYTPSLIEKYRSFQPLSMIIFQAMQDAIKNGYTYWNWGGTWLNQAGVYDFKKRWGTSNLPYYYFARLYDEKLRKLTREQLLFEYPNFYVLPFNKLQT